MISNRGVSARVDVPIEAGPSGLLDIVRSLEALAAPWDGLAERYARFLATAAHFPFLLGRGAELPVLLAVIEVLEAFEESASCPKPAFPL